MKRFAVMSLGAVTMMAIGVFVGMSMSGVEAAPAADARIYELRTYTTNEGKLDDLHNRFANHTNALFVRHGMTLVGYWTPYEGDTAENTLVYIIGHESREAAKDNWKGFMRDEEWKAAFSASREDGPLVSKVDSVFLTPTDYSPLR